LAYRLRVADDRREVDFDPGTSDHRRRAQHPSTGDQSFRVDDCQAARPYRVRHTGCAISREVERFPTEITETNNAAAWRAAASSVCENRATRPVSSRPFRSAPASRPASGLAG
jgi:hypothetical protein